MIYSILDKIYCGQKFPVTKLSFFLKATRVSWNASITRSSLGFQS